MKKSQHISMQGKIVYVVDGSRTPYLKATKPTLAFKAAELAVQAGQALLSRQPFAADTLDEVILGCVMPHVDEANIARIVALRLGCGIHMPAWTVQRNCGSGMQALDCAARNIAAGRADLILAGGVESMSYAPVLLSTQMTSWLADFSRARKLMDKVRCLGSLRPAYLKPVIGLICGLTDPVVGLSMGSTAEILAAKFNISREEMDAYAVGSHLRLASAHDEGRLGEIETIYDNRGNFYDHDQGVRRDSSVEHLSRLKPVFEKPFGSVTAGNSSQITDGAALLILASADAVKQYQLDVIGRIVDCEWAANDPAEMGLGPVHASSLLLQRHQLALNDIDYWELNEAFAAQVIACCRAFADNNYCTQQLGFDAALGEIDSERLNVDGGAISIGHPVGSSGARIVLHLLNVLQQKDAQTGIATQCIGGGQGGAMLLARS
ncbi:MAG TPA: acetyl-CoA C-acetyltransferase [Crenotrichaceae bacterium]|nr:acetyl-CoA C-acetyltransferase [Crenotrichaceae bacterium]